MTWKRVATAAVLIPFVVALVLFASTAWVTVVLAGVMTLALWEYFALGEAIGHRAYRLWTVVCALGLLWVQYLAADNGPIISIPYELVLFTFILGVIFLICASRRPLVEGLPSAGISCSALLLVAFPLSYAVRIQGQGILGPRVLLFTLAMIWMGDTTAYFVGRSIGRLKFAPQLSPNKTWEGAAASLAGSLLLSLAFTRWIPIGTGVLLGMAGVANVGGQIGDLVESAYKRSAGVKDSGTLLPGHGGILDRIDALILAIPVVWYYWSWFLALHRPIV